MKVIMDGTVVEKSMRQSGDAGKEVMKLRLVDVADPHETPACFRTDARYQCDNQNCQARQDCVRLVAAWLR